MHLFGPWLFAVTAAVALPAHNVKDTVFSVSSSPATSLNPREKIDHRLFVVANNAASWVLPHLTRRSLDGPMPEERPTYNEPNQDHNIVMTSDPNAELPILLGMLENQVQQLKPHQRALYHACREANWQEMVPPTPFPLVCDGSPISVIN